MIGVEVGVGVVVGVGSGVVVGVGVGVGLATATPLFHTSFLPLFTQVNFLPFVVAVIPAFLQLSPALTAATAVTGPAKRAIAIKMPSNFFMHKG